VTQVNRVVGREFQTDSDKKKQTPFFYSTLTAKLLLRPKLLDLQPVPALLKMDADFKAKTT
jgi:hypothetical protein